MAWQVKLLPSAAEELAALPQKPRRQIARRIDGLKENPRPRGVKALKGKGEGIYRVRSGDYRILYRIRDEELVVLVIKLGDRKDIYRGL